MFRDTIECKTVNKYILIRYYFTSLKRASWIGIIIRVKATFPQFLILSSDSTTCRPLRFLNYWPSSHRSLTLFTKSVQECILNSSGSVCVRVWCNRPNYTQHVKMNCHSAHHTQMQKESEVWNKGFNWSICTNFRCPAEFCAYTYRCQLTLRFFRFFRRVDQDHHLHHLQLWTSPSSHPNHHYSKNQADKACPE